jgi:hypothetical protein
MADSSRLGPWVRRCLLEHLIRSGICLEAHNKAIGTPLLY